MIVGASQNLSEIENGIRFLREKRIDALIVPGFICKRLKGRKALETCRFPVVLTEYEEGTSLPVVGDDDTTGIDPAVGHLADLGFEIHIT